MFKILLLSLFLFTNIFAGDKVYFLPKQNKQIKSEIIKLINTANKSIDIAMYNFKYVKFAKALEKASKRGVKVKIYYYKKKIKFKNNIIALKVKSKLHTKIAIIDKKTVIFGSANWTKDSFAKNYEVVYITNQKHILKKFNKFFKNIKRN
jgi:phosphatidylserine/phosphatidylglycerophosphate/cardiolipin synthase-like enzyme